ncbi:LysM peptidoglycan-binding domain-containing protein [Apibacter muscae]|uniref:LysM peptidoglycan-binding domain-containing protein n=1 Tax=Apibacter muscae TaxID=2509004 RepID=UPI0011ABAAF1|nr:LysM peptidoglycan-binding domain-containing protein [Apibacter muscae]TWP31795.1 LysM peptidoglycan-binding domain-containing protein [Apibacter muscae]
MEYENYIIEREEKLSSIANKFNTTPKEIKACNPNMRTFGGGVWGAEYASYGQRIRIPVQPLEPIRLQTDFISDIPIPSIAFNSKARYRCEQINETRVLETLTTYTNQKTQYLLEQNLEEGYAKIKLEEFLYEVIPPLLSDSFELIKSTEFIKNKAIFKLSEKGKIEQILNAKEISNQWKTFKEKELKNLPFIESLQDNTEAIHNINKAGDIEFNSPKVKEYQRNLFNFLCFDQHLYQPIEELEKEEFQYASSLLAPVIIPLEFKYNKVSEDNKFITFKKIADVHLTDSLVQKLKQKYDEVLKPVIKYSFTEYKLFFSCTLDWNKETKLLEKASVHLKETIADNIQNVCTFSLNQLKNYTP